MKFNRALVLKALEDSGGIKKNIAAKLGISRVTLDAWLAKDAVLAEAFTDEKEKLKDLADERLIEQIQMGNLGAIIWYQKTQCRDRGYVERQESRVEVHFDKMSDAQLVDFIQGGPQAEEPAPA